MASQASNIATIPLFYEMASSIVHPCSDTIVGAYLSFTNSIVTTLCSFYFYLSGIGKIFTETKLVFINIINFFLQIITTL